MKFSNLTILFSLFFVLYSCNTATEEKANTDTTKSAPDNSGIIGEWLGSHWEVGGSGTMTEDGVPMTMEFTLEAKNLKEEKYSIIFNEDHTVSSVSNNFTVHMKSKVAGMQFEHESETGFSLDNAQWELNGDILNITLSDEPNVVYPYKVIKLTNKELSIELDHIPDNLMEEMDENTQFNGYVKMKMIR